MAKRALAPGYRQRPDGKYECRFTVDGKRYSAYGDTIKECKEREIELREKIRNGQYVNNRNVTVDRFYQEWLISKQGVVKSGTILNIKTQYKNHIHEALGSRKLAELERRELIGFQQELAKNLKPSTVNLIMINLKSLLNDAVREGILMKNPAAGIKPVRDDSEAASETYHRALTEEEQRLFMEYAREEWLFELLAFLLCTGMRLGEATALTWNSVDMINNVIHVTQTVCRTEDGQTSVGTPKSKSSVRDIPLNEQIKSIVKNQKTKQQLLYGKVLPMTQRIFVGQGGGVLYNSVVNRAIDRTLIRMRKDGIEIKHFSAHAFRDTFATRYIEQGGSPQVLKTILGHSSLSMTMDLYSHVMPNKKQEEMNNVKIAF